MVSKIRLRLALQFVALVMLLYLAGGLAAMAVFSTGLSRSLDVALADLIAEIRPSVTVQEGRPSLRSWHEMARRDDWRILATVQLYDLERRLIEGYGPPGVPVMAKGRLQAPPEGSEKLSVRSMYIPVTNREKLAGYLQIQVSSEPQDTATAHFALTLLLIAPFLAIAVGATGYYFSGKAVQPIEQTLLKLKRFVTDAGHELKTPVAVIEGALQTIGDQRSAGEVSPGMLDMIRRASARLKALSSQLVLLAQIEDPDCKLPRSQIDLRRLLETIVADYEKPAQEKGISLELEPGPASHIEGNEELLVEMLSNLIDNAVKYTPSGGVTVSARTLDSRVQILVADSGPGIPPENIGHVFERFYRVDPSRSRDAGGSGLGLSIVRAAAEAHGGAVSVSSTPGRGSTFSVMLPAFAPQNRL